MIISLAGEWDVYRRDELRALLEPAGGAERVILDLTAAKYVTSTLMASLVLMHKRREAQHLPNAVLAVKSAFVQRLLVVAGIDRLVPIYPSLKEALGAAEQSA